MAGMEREYRADFWRDHSAVLSEAFAERGLADEVVAAILNDHLLRVRQIHAEREKAVKARKRYPINFAEPPELGTEIMVGKKRAILVGVEPITRRSDGAASYLLRWDVEGRWATSGLRSASVYWERADAGK